MNQSLKDGKPCKPLSNSLIHEEGKLNESSYYPHDWSNDYESTCVYFGKRQAVRIKKIKALMPMIKVMIRSMKRKYSSSNKEKGKNKIVCIIKKIMSILIGHIILLI